MTEPYKPAGYRWEGMWKVDFTGQRRLQRMVMVPNFSWYCDKPDCGAAGDGYESKEAALNSVIDHHQREHRRLRCPAKECDAEKGHDGDCPQIGLPGG